MVEGEWLFQAPQYKFFHQLYIISILSFLELITTIYLITSESIYKCTLSERFLHLLE
jgi:hypothetical protein